MYKVDSYKMERDNIKAQMEDLNDVIKGKDERIVAQGKTIKELSSNVVKTEEDKNRLNAVLEEWKKKGEKFLTGNASDNTESVKLLTEQVRKLSKKVKDMEIIRDRALTQAKENRELATGFRTQLLTEQGAHSKTKRRIPCSDENCSGDQKQCPFGHQRKQRTSKINRPCRYYLPQQGKTCNEGENCRFLHEQTQQNNTQRDMFEETKHASAETVPLPPAPAAVDPEPEKTKEEKEKEKRKAKKERRKEKKRNGMVRVAEKVVVLDSEEEKDERSGAGRSARASGSGSTAPMKQGVKVEPESLAPMKFNEDDYWACKAFQNPPKPFKALQNLPENSRSFQNLPEPPRTL